MHARHPPRSRVHPALLHGADPLYVGLHRRVPVEMLDDPLGFPDLERIVPQQTGLRSMRGSSDWRLDGRSGLPVTSALIDPAAYTRTRINVAELPLEVIQDDL